MGRVLLAVAPGGGFVAIKVIRPELAQDRQFRRQFRMEVARAQQVPPFCTAEVLDADPDHDPPYLVVEFIDGPSLQDLVERAAPLSAANLYAVAVNMAIALIAIHGAGLVHRDLKPSNVLLAPGSPKVIDFGLARPAGTMIPGASAGHVEGTIPFMAPEQFTAGSGAPLTQAADIFAWAGVVVFAGTGGIPFPGESAVEIARRIVTAAPRLGRLTGALRSLVEDAFAKEPADRPTARQLVDRLIAQSGAVNCPYPGLAAHREAEAELFLGREDLTAKLLRRLAGRLTGTGLMFVLGPSGSGKSSLIRAGLLASLDRGRLGVPGSRNWPRLVLTPGRHPVLPLAAAVARLARIPGGAVHDEIMANPRCFPIHVLQALRAATERGAMAGQPPGVDPAGRWVRPRLLLVVDQFEELFTVCERESERQAFITALRAAAGDDEHDQAALVVVGMRADFYGRCAAYSALAPVLEHNLTVGPMSPRQLRAAIEEPAYRTGLSLEPGLVEVLLRDIGAGPVEQASGLDLDDLVGRLPLLSHALRSTWARREGTVLTLAGYQATGGVHGAVAGTAEQIYHSLDDTGRTTLRHLLLHLVRIGDDTADVSQRVSITELAAEQSARDFTVGLLDRLAADRLITIDKDTAVITHEALLRVWPRLRVWIDQDRAGLLVRQRMTDTAQVWNEENRDPSWLYHGAQLDLARDYTDRPGGCELNPVTRAFLNASITQEFTRQRAVLRAARRRKILTSILAGNLLVASAASAATVWSEHRAADQQDIATALSVALQAQQLRAIQPGLAAQLSLVAYRMDPATGAAQVFASQLTPGVYNAGAPAVDLAQSGDGQLLAISTGHGIALRDAAGRLRSRIVAAATGPVALSADGHLLAAVVGADPTPGPPGRPAGGQDARQVRLSALTDVGHPVLLDLLPVNAPITALALSQDGRLLGVGTRTGAIQVWDVSDPRVPRPLGSLSGHFAAVDSLAFRPGRAELASSGLDGSVRLWRLGPGRARQLYRLPTSVPAGVPGVEPGGVGGGIGAPTVYRRAAFSPDGRLLATVGAHPRGDYPRVWNVEKPDAPIALTGPVGPGDCHPIHGIAFSPDQRLIAGTCARKDLRVWQFRGDGPPGRRLVPAAHLTDLPSTGGVLFRHGTDTDQLLHATTNGVAVWGLADPWRPGAPATLATDLAPGGGTLAFSRRGRRMLAVSGARGTVLWDLSDPREPRLLATYPGSAGSPGAGFSPDGGLFAHVEGAGAQRVVVLRRTDAPHAEPVGTIRGITGPVTAVEFSPHRHTLAVQESATIKLYDIGNPAGPRLLRELAGHGGELSFSPDGRLLIGYSADTLLSWDLTDPGAPVALPPRRLSTGAAGTTGAFGPDGSALVVGDGAGVLRLWRVRHNQLVDEPRIIRGPAPGRKVLALGPDGHTLAVQVPARQRDGATDVELWDLADPETPVRLATFPVGGDVAASDLAFSHDGRLLAVSRDVGVDLWHTDPEQVAAELCDTVGDVITPAQWRLYLPDLPYQPPCPDR